MPSVINYNLISHVHPHTHTRTHAQQSVGESRIETPRLCARVSTEMSGGGSLAGRSDTAASELPRIPLPDWYVSSLPHAPLPRGQYPTDCARHVIIPVSRIALKLQTIRFERRFARGRETRVKLIAMEIRKIRKIRRFPLDVLPYRYTQFRTFGARVQRQVYKKKKKYSTRKRGEFL